MAIFAIGFTVGVPLVGTRNAGNHKGLPLHRSPILFSHITINKTSIL